MFWEGLGCIGRIWCAQHVTRSITTTATIVTTTLAVTTPTIITIGSTDLYPANPRHYLK